MVVDNPDVDPPLISLWTIVAVLTGAGVMVLIGVILLRRLMR